MIYFSRVSKKITRPHQPVVLVLENANHLIATNRIVAIHGENAAALTAFISLATGVLRPDHGRIYRQGTKLSPIINAGGTAGATQFGMMSVLETIRWHARFANRDERTLLALLDKTVGISDELHLPIYAVEWHKRRAMEVALVSTTHYGCFIYDHFDHLSPCDQDYLVDLCLRRRVGLIFTTVSAPLCKQYGQEIVTLAGGQLMAAESDSNGDAHV